MIPSQLQICPLNCPLCQNSRSKLFHQAQHKTYYQCSNCQLVFLDPNHRLSLDQERAQYDLHQNQLDDPQYRKFLNRIYQPLVNLIKPPTNVLDFGCGPGPALAEMFKEAGYNTSIYDPYFFPDNQVFKQKYQIITLTEVIEHCHNPLEVLYRLKYLLSDNGIIAIMTKRLTHPEKFPNWHYKNDPTHVCFFSIATFQWIAEELAMELEICGDDSVLLKT